MDTGERSGVRRKLAGAWHAVRRRPLQWLVCVVLAAAVIGCARLAYRADEPNWERMRERAERIERAPLKDYVRAGGMAGGWIASGACLLLLISARWWLFARPGGGREGDLAVRIPAGFWVALAVVILIAGFIRWPRLGLGYYSDEVYTLRMFIRGDFERDSPLDEPEFVAADWRHTLWDYRRPNNHVFFSVAARSLWEALDPAACDPWRPPPEWILRLPAYLAGLASIGVLCVFLARAGLLVPSLLAGILLAFHPWHIFHSVTLRGYAFVFLFSMCAAWSLHEGLRSTRGWWWLLYGIACFLLLGTYPAQLYLIVLLTAGAAGYLWMRRRWVTLARLAASQLLLLAAIAPFAAVWAPQMRIYLARNAPKGQCPDAAWIVDTLGLQLLGIPWHPWADDHPHVVAILPMLESRPVLMGVVVFMLVGMLVAGIAYLLMRKRSPGWIFLAFLPAAAAGVVLAILNHDHLYHWYCVFAAPAFCAMASCSTGWLRGGIFGGRAGGRVLQCGAAAVVAALFVIATQEQRSIVRHVPKEPIREVAERLGRWRDSSSAAIVASVWPNVMVYDPAIPSIQDVAELELLLRESRESGRPLVVSTAYLPVHRGRRDGIVFRLEESGDFRKLATLHGLESENSDYTLFIHEPD